MNVAIEMAKRLLVDSIYKSANLEGLGTTFPDTQSILDNLPVETSREEVLFIVNMKRAWNFLFGVVGYKNNLALLREFNKIVGDNLFYENGEIRVKDVKIGGTEWTPGTPDLADINVAINNLNNIEDPELRALKYFCFIARTQMFIDGNKRVAQLIANKILIENEVGIFQVPIRAIKEFTILLVGFYESGKDERIIDFMKTYCVNRVSGVSKKYEGEIEKESSVVFEYPKEEGSFLLSSSQLKLVNSVLRNLRRLLYVRGYLDAVLYDDGGRVCLSCDGNIYYMGSGDLKLDEFLSRTVGLIELRIPLPIKKIRFSVSDKILSCGYFSKSFSEVGSIDLELL